MYANKVVPFVVPTNVCILALPLILIKQVYEKILNFKLE